MSNVVIDSSDYAMLCFLLTYLLLQVCTYMLYIFSCYLQSFPLHQFIFLLKLRPSESINFWTISVLMLRVLLFPCSLKSTLCFQLFAWCVVSSSSFISALMLRRALSIGCQFSVRYLDYSPFCDFIWKCCILNVMRT